MWNEERPTNAVRQEMEQEFLFLDNRPSLHDDIMCQIRGKKSAGRKMTVGALVAALLALMTLTGLAVSLLKEFVFLNQAEHGQLYACTVKDDHLYVLGQNGLWVYPPGGRQARQLVRREKMPPFANPLRLELLASEPLMLMDRETNRIWRMEKDGFSLEMSYAGTELSEVDDLGTDFVWQDGRLFIQSDQEGSIYRAELDSCAVEKMSVEHAIRLVNYQQGMLLALTYTERQGTSVMTISTDNGEAQMVCSDPGLGIKGVSYAEKKDGIYAVVSGFLSRWDGKEWRRVHGAALPHVSFFCGAFGDVYVAANYEGIQFFPLDDADEKVETLVIQGAADSAVYDHGFQQLTPGVAIARRIETDFTAEDAVRALQAGSEADLFHVRISSDRLEKLWQLAHPLDSEQLMADISEMTPVLQMLLVQQGELYAVPSSMFVEAWKTGDEQQTAAPATLQEVLETKQYAIGEETFEGEAQVTMLWQQKEYAAYLLKQMLMEKKAGIKSMTDRAFISLLEALKAWETPETAQEIWYHTTVALAGYLHGSSGVIPYTMPPVITGEDRAWIPASVTVYILNPASRHKETAIRYLEYVAANRFSWEDALMKPDMAKPVLIQWAQERIAGMDEESKQRREIEENPENWEVLEENLRFYREQIAPRLVVGDVSVHVLGKDEQAMLDVILEYLQGKTTAEECAGRLEQMAECAILEAAFN